MAERMDLRKELISSFTNFKQAFLDLESIRGKIKESGDKSLSVFMETSMTQDYPFRINFDDMVEHIVPWVNKKIDELKIPLLQYIMDAVMDNLSNLPDDVKSLVISELSKK